MFLLQESLYKEKAQKFFKSLEEESSKPQSILYSETAQNFSTFHIVYEGGARNFSECHSLYVGENWSTKEKEIGGGKRGQRRPER